MKPLDEMPTSINEDMIVYVRPAESNEAPQAPAPWWHRWGQKALWVLIVLASLAVTLCLFLVFLAVLIYIVLPVLLVLTVWLLFKRWQFQRKWRHWR